MIYLFGRRMSLVRYDIFNIRLMLTDNIRRIEIPTWGTCFRSYQLSSRCNMAIPLRNLRSGLFTPSLS
jgi:hypothetical protein